MSGVDRGRHYFVFVHRPGPAWLPGLAITEQPLQDHFAYMTELEATGQLVLGGGFVDGAGAMGVLTSPDLATARRLVEADPAVQRGVVTPEVHPYLCTVAGCLERSVPG